jgi:hypothetical protein
MRRYCSAVAMLGHVAKIEETVRVIDDASGAEQTAAAALAA